MSTVRKYLIIHIFITASIILYILFIKKELLDYACIFIVGLFAVFGFFVAAPKTSWLSNYLKNNYKEIYKRKSSGRKYAFKDLVDVNILSIKESDLKTIMDVNVVKLIRELKLVLKFVFITTILCILLLVIRAYL